MYNIKARGSNFDLRPEGMDEDAANQLAAQAFLQQVSAADMNVVCAFQMNMCTREWLLWIGRYMWTYVVVLVTRFTISNPSSSGHT